MLFVSYAALALTCAAGARAEAVLPPSETVRFDSEDGVHLVGTYYPPSGATTAPPAILLPMYRSERKAYEPLVGPLHDAGFAVLAIDMRGHGDSVKPASMQLAARVVSRDASLFAAMYKDVQAAVKWIGSRPHVDTRRLVLVGASVGCSVAFDYASRDHVTAMVCMSPGIKYLGLDTAAHMKRISDTPMLLLATELERKQCEDVAGMNDGATARIVGGHTRAHGTRMFGRVKGVEKIITDFLSTHATRIHGE